MVERMKETKMKPVTAKRERRDENEQDMSEMRKGNE